MAKQGRIATHKAQERERLVASVMALCAREYAPATRALVIDDLEGELERELIKQGVAVARWCRFSFEGQPGQPWPAPGPYDAVYLRLPRIKAAFELAVEAAASELGPGGTLWVYGANDEGIKSADKVMARCFMGIATRETKRHCRVLSGRLDRQKPFKAPLTAWAEAVTLPFGEAWVSYPGVFAKGGLDEGTKLLLEALPDPQPGAKVLDYAAGMGVISRWCALAQPECALWMLEADAIALEAAKLNVPNAHALLSDAWHSVDGALRFDLIVSNPPIHRGKSEDFSALLALIDAAGQRLLPSGELWLVVQRQVPLESMLKERFGLVEVKSQDGRFTVWRCARPRR